MSVSPANTKGGNVPIYPTQYPVPFYQDTQECVLQDIFSSYFFSNFSYSTKDCFSRDIKLFKNDKILSKINYFSYYSLFNASDEIYQASKAVSFLNILT